MFINPVYDVFCERIKGFVGHKDIIMDISTPDESPLERGDYLRNNSLTSASQDFQYKFV